MWESINFVTCFSKLRCLFIFFLLFYFLYFLFHKSLLKPVDLTWIFFFCFSDIYSTDLIILCIERCLVYLIQFILDVLEFKILINLRLGAIVSYFIIRSFLYKTLPAQFIIDINLYPIRLFWTFYFRFVVVPNFYPSNLFRDLQFYLIIPLKYRCEHLLLIYCAENAIE